jgi:hypothetical protein
VTGRALIVLDFPDEAGVDLSMASTWAVSALRDVGLWPDGALVHLAIQESARRVLVEFDHSQEGL